MSAVAVQLCIFSIGWLSLHALRAHARHLTPILASVALALGLFLLAVLSARSGLPADMGAVMGQWAAD